MEVVGPRPPVAMGAPLAPFSSCCRAARALRSWRRQLAAFARHLAAPRQNMPLRTLGMGGPCKMTICFKKRKESCLGAHAKLPEPNKKHKKTSCQPKTSLGTQGSKRLLCFAVLKSDQRVLGPSGPCWMASKHQTTFCVTTRLMFRTF